MQLRYVPAINARYWVAITLTSVFGANMGDFVSHTLHMGHLRGLPYILAAFALVFVAAAVSRIAWEGWYWLAIVALRTAATNVADLTIGAVGTLAVCAALIGLMAVILSIGRTAVRNTVPADLPRTDAVYWLTMLLAGTLGTALGDGLANSIGLHGATLISAVAVGLALSARQRALLGPVAAYWLAVAVIRTFGTNVGDTLAHQIGLAISTPLTGAALLLLLLIWRDRHRPATVTA